MFLDHPREPALEFCVLPYSHGSFLCTPGASGSDNPIVLKEGNAIVLPGTTESTTAGQTESLTAEELRQRRQAYFDRQDNSVFFSHAIECICT